IETEQIVRRSRNLYRGDSSGMLPTVRSRPLHLIASSIVCRVTLATAALGSMALAADARLISMLPEKSEAVAGVNLKAILHSGLAQEFMKSPGSGAGSLAEFTAMTGVDINRDIDEVLFAGFTPHAGQGAPKPGSTIGVGFVTGTF